MGRPAAGVAVTGAGGRVGSALRRHLPGARLLSHEELDVTDGTAVRRALAGVACVVHAAGMTHVDACEANPEEAFAVNAEGTRRVVETGVRVLYLSSDHVFDGAASKPYCENDPTRPVNAYGRSKLDGEGHVLRRAGNLVVRTSWVFGEGRDFVQKVLDDGRAGRELMVVDDQRGRPTPADGLARAIVALLESRTSGIVHVAGAGPSCSRAELAEVVLASAGAAALVERVDSATYARRIRRALAPRPRNGVLCLHRARELGIPLEDWRTAVRRYVGARA